MAYPAGWSAPGNQPYPPAYQAPQAAYPPQTQPAYGAYPPPPTQAQYPSPAYQQPVPLPAQPAAPQPILNPRIPYIGQIAGGMRPGKMVVIQGNVPRNADRFHINFQVGASTQPRADIAFHFAVRLKQGAIVRNTLEKEKWGQEERAVPSQPFQYGQSFEIMIMTDKEEFKVAVNGQHFLGYKHRMRPLKKIDYLNINGDVTITSIKFHEEPAAPVARTVAPAGPILNPATPYIGLIPNGMSPGKMIIINGISTPNPKRFGINLQIGHNAAKTHDIVFHFNPRFEANTIVCNTRQQQKWGPEEKSTPYFPFQPNTNFEIIFLCQNDCYKVAVNGQHLLEFRHRIAYQQVDTLHIAGNVRITQIRYQ